MELRPLPSAIAVLAPVLFRGFLASLPVLVAIITGYILSVVAGIVDLSPVFSAPWFALPSLYTPSLHPSAILIILPAAFVVLAEHIGHLVVTGTIVGKDLVRDPGLDRTLLGNGLSTVISGFFGSTPNTWNRSLSPVQGDRMERRNGVSLMQNTIMERRKKVFLAI